ncbi:MAG: hypothetical protein AAGF97_09740 [Planctomycetota bacterium]
MVRMATDLLSVITYHMSRWSPTEWTVIAICLVLLGFFCMRGFGSHKSY